MMLLPAFTGAPEPGRVYHTTALDLMRAMPDAYVDLIVTSPPYDNLRTYNGYTFDFEPIAHESYRVLKQGGVLIWVVGDSTIDGDESLTAQRQQLYFHDSVGFKSWDTMIWRKFLPGDYGKRYCQSFEYMFVLARGEAKTWNPQMRVNKSAGKLRPRQQRSGYITDNGYLETGGVWKVAEYGVMENVWDIQPSEGFGGHPAPFPEKLAERHILTWSNPGDLVLDYFMGSGTTAKMARNNDRHYIGCDISLEYVELARKRLAQPYTPSMFTAPTTTEPQAEQVALFATTAVNE